MKKKYKFRKELQLIAEHLGLPDQTILAHQSDPGTKKQYPILINNQRRFVKGMLKLSLSEQRDRITQLYKKIAEVEAQNDTNG